MKKYLLHLVLFLSITCIAQTPGDIAQSFGSSLGFNGPVNTIAQQADGKILLGGGFTSYNGATENRIVRLNADGSKDSSFNTGTAFNSGVITIQQQTDGKILVGGFFTTYNGITENYIIRLNSDGSKDNTFTTGTGFNSAVYAIYPQADGKILVGGFFSTYNGVTENSIIRLNSDGSKDTSFNNGTGFNNGIRTIKQQTDGKILVGGDFTSYNGVTENRIVRLNADGSKDTSFNLGTGFNNTIYTIQPQTDGKILVGGEFTSFNGLTENKIVRLNPDGSKDTSFNTGTGFNEFVRTIHQQADGKILVGGFFTTYNGITENYIIRLNSDGSKDNTFTTGTGFNSTVLSIYPQTDGKILVGGFFSTYNGVRENSIIRLNSDGSKDTSFNNGTGFNNGVRTIQQQTDGKILVGGDFTSYKGVTENRIIRLNSDGTKDATFNTGTGFSGIVWAIAQQADGKILVGGFFTTYKGVAENCIIRLNSDGSKDSSFNTGTGFNNTVWTIKQQSDGKILVGGEFTSYNSVTEKGIIRLNLDGSKDTSFNTGTGFDADVLIIQPQTNGKILVGGNFNSYNNVTENFILRLNADGTKDTSFNTGTGFNNNIITIQTQADGKILAGGNFDSYNGVGVSKIIRLNTDGSKDTSFTGTGFNNLVLTIQPETDGKILVGGFFNSYNGLTENRIVRLNADGSKDTSFNTGTGFNNAVWTIQQQADGKILVGGNFTTYNDDNSSAFLIGLHSEQSLSSNSFNLDKTVVVYPNPVKDILHLQLNNFSTLQSVKIYDLQGKIVLQDTKDNLNLSNLSNGLYLIKVITSDGEFTKKFIKE
jgi:uncharacterized delta-60 repeat protein